MGGAKGVRVLARALLVAETDIIESPATERHDPGEFARALVIGPPLNGHTLAGAMEGAAHANGVPGASLASVGAGGWLSALLQYGGHIVPLKNPAPAALTGFISGDRDRDGKKEG